ncbi:MAG: hypothetical protein D6E12_01175 [Desulfovibrio sp.]|nr:MAG: hypothetical protein D6E12_01175 [Desulfovibrio sp.]
MKQTAYIVLAATALALACFAAGFLAGCSESEENGSVIVAKINDYEMTREEFQRRLAEELRYYGDMELTEEMKQQFLDQLVRKELLIQQAVAQHLDRREEFVRAIERYWETTLIRDMLDIKGAEIAETTLVTREEVERRYEEMLAANPDLGEMTDEMHDHIQQTLIDEKMTGALEAWIEELKSSADIEIDEAVFASF